MRLYVKRRDPNDLVAPLRFMYSKYLKYKENRNVYLYLITLPPFEKDFSTINSIPGVHFVDSEDFPEMYYPLTQYPTCYGLFDLSNILNVDELSYAFYDGNVGRGWLMLTKNEHFSKIIFPAIKKRFVDGGEECSFYNEILQEGGILSYSIIVGDENYNTAAEEYIFMDDNIWKENNLFHWADILYSIEPGEVDPFLDSL